MNEFETQLEFLIDGELEPTIRSKFVQRCEENPELWRHVALAFMENQIVNQSIRQSSNELQAAFEETRVSGSSTANQSIWPRVGWMGALAASLLLGLYLGSAKFNSQSESLARSDVTVERPVEDELFELADAMARSPLPIPTEFRRELLKGGFHVDELEQRKTVNLPIGGSVEIPTRHVVIKYLGSNVYQ